MRARFGLLVLGLCSIGCTLENPAFDEPTDTQSDSTTDASTTANIPDLPPGTTDEGSSSCGLSGGQDMQIKVPQPCGETNDALDTYEHWFNVVEAAGSTWSVQFCSVDCLECEPLPADLVFSPLSVAELAGPGTCMLMNARRLGEADDCSYHTVTLQDMSAGGHMLVVARRTQLLQLPDIPSATGLLGFEPALVEVDSCDCVQDPDACCGGQAPTLYSYEVNGLQIPIGDVQPVSIGGRDYDFWAFDAFQPGECNAPINLSWALVASN